MESTAFDLILLPVILATFGSLASFWLVSVIAGCAGTVVHRLVGDHGVVDPLAYSGRSRCQDRCRQPLRAERTRMPSPEVGPKYRRRLVG